jgi:hypothetical protein
MAAPGITARFLTQKFRNAADTSETRRMPDTQTAWRFKRNQKTFQDYKHHL